MKVPVLGRFCLNFSEKCAKKNLICFVRNIFPCSSNSYSSNVSDNDVPTTVPAEWPKMEEVDASEVEKKRNKSHMPEDVRREVFDLIPINIRKDNQYKMFLLRKRYAKYGSASGLNPGICFPTKEELDSMIEYENLSNPNLFTSLERVKEKKKAEDEYRRSREKQILSNMEKLKKWKQDMIDNEAKKKSILDIEAGKRSLLIEEVQEYMGYQVDPSDPKFQELLAKKEEEIKKATKAARKKEKHEKMLAQLLSVGESLQKKDEEGTKTSPSGQTMAINDEKSKSE